MATNDPNKPALELSIDGKSASYVFARPSAVDFDDTLAASLPTIQEVYIYPGRLTNPADFFQTRVTSQCPYIAVSTRAGEKWLIAKVVLKKEAPVGITRSLIKLTWPTKIGYEIHIPIVVNVLGPYSIQPSSLDFGVAPPGGDVQRKCIITGLDPTDTIEIDKISNSAANSLVLHLIRNQRTCTIEADFHPRTELGVIDDNIQLRVSHEGVKSPTFLQIPILGFIRKE